MVSNIVRPLVVREISIIATDVCSKTTMYLMRWPRLDSHLQPTMSIHAPQPAGEFGLSEDWNSLFPKVYDELKRLALKHMATEREDHTLTPTALLHEAYLRVASESDQQVPLNRVQFFAIADQAMRRILVEHGRKHTRRKSIVEEHVLPDFESKQLMLGKSIDLVCLDEALEKLSVEHPEKAKLVEIRYFGGLTMIEAAGYLNMPLITANRHWAYARAWLARAVADE